MDKFPFDIKSLKELIEKGQLILLEEEKDKIKYRRCAMVVNTTIDRAWNVLTDFKNYSKFIPGVQSSAIIDEFGNEVTVQFVIGVKFMGVGGTIKHTVKYILNKPELKLVDYETEKERGYWQIIPINDKKVILSYYDEAIDVKTLHPVVRFFIQKLPAVELAFYVAPVSMLVKAIKKQIEKK